MSKIDSRLGPGTLTVGTAGATVDFTCQVTAAKLVPSTDSEDGTPTLCDPTPAPEATESWSLEGSVIQDWEDPAGFVEFCRLHSGEVHDFTFTPNTAKAVTFSGQCQVRAVEIGGDVGVQNTTDFEFPIVGDLVRVDTRAGGASEIVEPAAA